MNGPVRSVVDIQALQVDGYADRGIGRYVAAYASAMARADRVAAALLAPELPPPAGLPHNLVASDLVRWDCRAEARRLLTTQPGVVYHVMAPFLHSGLDDPAILAVAPHWAEAAPIRIVTVYDLIPLRAPRHYLANPAAEERYRTRARWVASADLVFAISEYTAAEVVELLDCPKEKVVTVGAGVSGYFCPPDGTDDRLWDAHFADLEGRPFVLTVGGSDARKGTERLIEAVGRLNRRGWDLALVVVGDLTADWRKLLQESAVRVGIGDRLTLTGPINDELLRACYRRAAVSVMPSLAEGSGLPVLESAASGTPALASVTTALGEVAATPLAAFDPADTDSIAESIAAALSDGERRASILATQQSLAAASTWEAVAGRAAAALDGLAGRAGPSPSPVPLTNRLAVVGPLPPHGGGIGAYNKRLLEALAGSVRVDAVTDWPISPEVPSTSGHTTAATVGRDVRAASYDAVLYTLGNSGGHLATVELALRYPGWLWLHEVRLPGVAETALEHLDEERHAAALEWLLHRAYPGRAPIGAARRAGRSTLDLAAAGIGLVAPLLERCRGVLVNSQLARRLLLLDLAPLAYVPPIHVLPPACPPVRMRADSPAEQSDPVVAAFGVVSMSKRPDILVDAAARAGCRLHFVGPCPAILVQVITERARLRGIEDRVQVSGSVSDVEWRDWMARAALAVQLRDTSTGETSAAVLEALSAGVPVVTNLDTARELPDGTVSFLPDLTADAVAGGISELLESVSDRQALSVSGQTFAVDHQFDGLASAVLYAVLDT